MRKAGSRRGEMENGGGKAEVSGEAGDVWGRGMVVGSSRKVEFGWGKAESG